MSDRQHIEALERRRAGMDAEYSLWEPHFKELRDNIVPTKGRFSLGENRAASTINKRIIDPSARKALRTLKSGLMAGMTSPSRPWFRLAVAGTGAMEDPEVKEWAHITQARMYDVLRGSNIYRTLDACYAQLGIFGTFGGLVVGDFENVIHTHAFPLGLFRIAENGKGEVDTLHRDCRMTVAQVVDMFGLENLSRQTRKRFEQNDLHGYVDICHAIEPRHERDPLSPLSKDRPWASYYWEKGEDTFLDVGGYGANPILAPRWERTEGDVWATSCPGMEALGDSVQLQQQHKDKALAIQKSYNPPLQGANDAARTSYRNIPGGISTVSANDLQRQGLRPIYEVKPDISGLVMDINETRRRISEAFFEDLFLLTAMSDRRQVTAREIAERHEEKLLVLGPVLESLDHGLLQPLIEATYHHMQEAGIVPPAPESIEGRPIKVEYISLLAQAQKAVGVAAIERTIGFAATLEQLRPGAMDVIDIDTTLREFADQVGPPPAMLHTPEEVKAAREARAQAQQQQQMLEAAQPMANAAKLISEASERGADGLQQGGAI